MLGFFPVNGIHQKRFTPLSVAKTEEYSVCNFQRCGASVPYLLINRRGVENRLLQSSKIRVKLHGRVTSYANATVNGTSK